jgi:hypothetical protein
MPNITGSFSGRATAQSAMSVPDVANHEVNLMHVSGVQRSPDDNWNNTRIHYWGISDLLDGRGTQHGYFVNEHEDGGRDHGTFEGKVAIIGGQMTIEGTWKFIDGTGKYKGLAGNGTYRGRMTAPGVFEDTWEGAYELAVQTQAA